MGSDERLQEERLRLAEKGNLGWVQREVQPRQWADQVQYLSGILGLGDFLGLTSIFRRLLHIVDCLGEEGGAEQNEAGHGAQKRADSPVNTLPSFFPLSCSCPFVFRCFLVFLFVFSFFA